MHRNSLSFFVRTIFLSLAGLVLFSGCSTQLKTYEVTGRVEFENNRPVMVGLVECLSEKHKINASGTIHRDGTFTLTTFEDGDGAIAGKHRCVVLQMVIGENVTGYQPSAVGVVDPIYASYQTSGLEIDVTPQGPNKFTLHVRGIVRQPTEGAPHNHKP